MTIEFIDLNEEGYFQWPERKYELAGEALNIALDSRDGGRISEADYIKNLEELIVKYPNFIDGYAHLGYALLDQGKPKKALDYHIEGITVGEKHLPEFYKGKLIWGYYENRPFLRALHGSILCYMRLGRRKKAIDAMEKSLRLNPDDNLGIRFLIGPEYVRQGKFIKAREILVESAFSYPPFQYELALIDLIEGDWISAATQLRKGYISNPYIAEVLTGTPSPIPLAVWHSNNFSETNLAIEYAEQYLEIWYENYEYILFIRWLFNQPKVLRERAQFLEYQDELNWVRDFNRRGEIVDEMQNFEKAIDDQLSKEIVQPRQDKYGNTIFPWLSL
ncbi:tetratricopeptide repeat protein [Terasakiella pusilla]|jgi:tetratricopeptide (TPR) repeat protein|uniref:tetratricopeptide repeat protein n=1 Tax=Terasakiella pusilla TaxID=64973 RepID=UPI000570DF40|nr:tetratricopeptide repeat protein [Terasakiella pusilla]